MMSKFLFVIITASSFFIHHTTSHAHEIELGGITIKHPIIPIFGSKMKTAVGYFTIVNKMNEVMNLLRLKLISLMQ